MDSTDLVALIAIAVERLVAVSIGGMSIYFGYRLFMNLPGLPSGDGSIAVEGKAALTLTRVGPGVFFSLFGATVVAVALQSPMSMERTEAPGSSHFKTTGALPGATAPGNPTLAMRRDVVERTIGDLNTAPGLLAPQVDDARRQMIANAIDQAKRDLLRGVWSADWGAWDQFEQWTFSRGSPPALAAEPARIYDKGSQR